jgi:hypothetical protein
MSKRTKPGADHISMPAEEPHEGMLREMHDALYQLGDKARKPFSGNGSKLLPKDLRNEEAPEAKAARGHIATLHKMMKGCTEGK